MTFWLLLTAVMCPVLDPPMHGVIVTQGSSYNDVIEFDCNTGYNLQGSRQRTCQQDGQWSGELTTCNPVTCPVLDPPMHGVIVTQGSLYNDVIEFDCNTGYNLQGSRQRTCQQDGQWSGELTTCNPVMCPVLDPPMHGVIVTQGSSYNDVIEFDCNTGYNLQGSRQRTCQQDGQWSGELTTCNPVMCPVLDPPMHGVIVTQGSSYNDVIEFDCNTGYNLQGSRQRTCQQDGQWSGELTICIIHSNQSPCVVPRPQTDVIILSGGDIIDPFVIRQVEHGRRLEFRCGDPQTYILISESESVCTNAVWSHTSSPRCVIRCPEISALENGNIVGDKFYRNQWVEFTCDEGFNLKGSRRRRCNSTGEWTGTETYCMDSNASPCIIPLPQTPVLIYTSSGGIIDPSIQRRAEHGTLLAFRCVNPEEYILTSEPVSECDNGEWSVTSNPRCVIRCPEISAPENGNIVGDKFYRNQWVEITCDDGFNLKGSRRRRCNSTGEWTGTETYCMDNSKWPCVVPGVGNQPVVITTSGSVVDRNEQRTLEHDTHIDFQCADPYTHTLITEQTSTCVNGSWSHSENPKCYINCPVLNAPVNGLVTGDKYYRTQSLTFSCNEGYRLRGSRRRVCTGSGEWSGRDVSCSPIENYCGDPGSIVDGKITGVSFNTWDMVIYECNAGYYLSGPSSLLCLPGNQWSGQPPTCGTYSNIE
ncbi:CUB and sushi domain-containing protein 1-like [Antedon mediterranea]|uniref:CUB and sushi domain-containing protein 1-like n=1 Tax=Antedon mediterranea TaxID=105859 RepID=UPI003AF77E3F